MIGSIIALWEIEIISKRVVIITITFISTANLDKFLFVALTENRSSWKLEVNNGLRLSYSETQNHLWTIGKDSATTWHKIYIKEKLEVIWGYCIFAVFAESSSLERVGYIFIINNDVSSLVWIRSSSMFRFCFRSTLYSRPLIVIGYVTEIYRSISEQMACPFFMVGI